MKARANRRKFPFAAKIAILVGAGWIYQTHQGLYWSLQQIIAPKLAWPAVTTWDQWAVDDIGIRNPNGAWTTFNSGSYPTYVAANGAELWNLPTGEHKFELKYAGKSVYQGFVQDITSDGTLVAMITDQCNTTVFDSRSSSLQVQKGSWIALFPGGRASASFSPISNRVEIQVDRNGKPSRTYSTSLPKIDQIRGLSSDGTNAVLSLGSRVEFYTPNGSWNKGAGFLHEFRQVKIVDSNSFLTPYFSTSGIMGSIFCLELSSQWRTEVDQHARPCQLSTGEDSKRLARWIENYNKVHKIH